MGNQKLAQYILAEYIDECSRRSQPILIKDQLLSNVYKKVRDHIDKSVVSYNKRPLYPSIVEDNLEIQIYKEKVADQIKKRNIKFKDLPKSKGVDIAQKAVQHQLKKIPFVNQMHEDNLNRDVSGENSWPHPDAIAINLYIYEYPYRFYYSTFLLFIVVLGGRGLMYTKS